MAELLAHPRQPVKQALARQYQSITYSNKHTQYHAHKKHMTLNQEQLTELRTVLTTRFNEGELRTLCFDLGIDYDDLLGEGKSNKARELAAYIVRHDKVKKFIQTGQHLRPDIRWNRLGKRSQSTSLEDKKPSFEKLNRLKIWFVEIKQRRPHLLKGVTIAGAVTFVLAIIGLFADLSELGFPVPTLTNPDSTAITEQNDTDSIPDSNKTINIGGNAEDSIIIQSDQGDITVSHVPLFDPSESTHTESSFVISLIDGYELLEKNDLNGAEDKFEYARSLEPESPEPWYWKSLIAVGRNDYKVAQLYLDEALRLDPKHIHSLALKIKIFIIIGDSKSANTLANHSYGVSDTLDEWLNCLSDNDWFSPEINYGIDFELQCPSFQYRLE